MAAVQVWHQCHRLKEIIASKGSANYFNLHNMNMSQTLWCPDICIWCPGELSIKINPIKLNKNTVKCNENVHFIHI